MLDSPGSVGASGRAGAAAVYHNRGGVGQKQASLRLGTHSRQRREQDVRSGLAREAVRALHMVEMLNQAELLQDGASRRTALRGSRTLTAAERRETFDHAGINPGQAVLPREIHLAILREHLVHTLLRGIRDYIGKEIEQMSADVALEVIEADRTGGVNRKHLLDSAADVLGAVQQSAVDVEQIDRKRGDHAGWEPSLRPGTRRPLSGRITCCTPPPGVSFGACGANVWPLINWVTSLPSRISRTSSISAIVTRASECWLMTASAVS